jgi:UDPglucose 6-dehydrogenase
MREAASLVVVAGMLECGANVHVHDPEAMTVARAHFGERVTYHEDNYEAVAGADALVILTEWRPYRRPDFEKLRSAMRRALVFDGRNLFDPQRMKELGFDYVSIGRPDVFQA